MAKCWTQLAHAQWRFLRASEVRGGGISHWDCYNVKQAIAMAST